VDRPGQAGLSKPSSGQVFKSLREKLHNFSSQHDESLTTWRPPDAKAVDRLAAMLQPLVLPLARGEITEQQFWAADHVIRRSLCMPPLPECTSVDRPFSSEYGVGYSTSSNAPSAPIPGIKSPQTATFVKVPSQGARTASGAVTAEH
jgi:hypothetical protein